jgi:ATP-binding cassette subfamily C protein CydD
LASRPTGRLTTLVTRGLDAVEPYVRDYLPQLAVAAVLPVAVVVQLAVADPVSALVVLATLPLVPVFAALTGARAKAAATRQWATLSALGGHFLDAVSGLPTLVLFGRAQAHAAVVRGLAAQQHRATLRTLRIAFLSALVLELLAALSVALVAVPVALRLLEGTFGVRTALLVLMVVPEAYLPLRLAGQRFHAATEALAVSAELADVLAIPVAARPAAARPAAADPVGARAAGTVWPPMSGPLSVRLEQVTVSHPGRAEPVLRSADLVVEPGQWRAMAGPSGSGKSTVFALLLGLVQPVEGRVRIGDHDLPTMDKGALCMRLAWLPQRPHLFSGTVADNIRLGAPAATDQQVDDAVRTLGVAEFADRSTVLGERGRTLSTGQRQRVALARLIVRVGLFDPAVVLLDEPTAGLDLATESAVLAVLRAELAGCTVLVATHRPAVLDVAEGVSVLRHGGFRGVVRS